jgi:hypothetical protein
LPIRPTLCSLIATLLGQKILPGLWKAIVRPWEKTGASLLGMHFTIMGSDKGARAEGTVKTCDLAQACIELYERTEDSCAGDLATPTESPQATDLERFLGNILFIVSE